MARMRLPVMMRRARGYVGHWIATDERNGIVVAYEEALRFAGQISHHGRNWNPVATETSWAHYSASEQLITMGS